MCSSAWVDNATSKLLSGNGNSAASAFLSAYIESLMSKLMASVITDRNLADLSLESYGKELLKQGSNHINVKNTLERQLKTVETKISNLLDVYIEGSINKTIYDKKHNALKSEKLLIEEQLNKLPKETAETTLEKLRNLKKYCYDLQKMFDNGDDDVKSDLLKSVLWKTSIQDREIASVQYNMPYKRLAEASKSDDIAIWRREWDSNPRATFVARRFPGEPIWPLSHPSTRLQKDFNTHSFNIF